jgi:hypothetical protein
MRLGAAEIFERQAETETEWGQKPLNTEAEECTALKAVTGQPVKTQQIPKN